MSNFVAKQAAIVILCAVVLTGFRNESSDPPSAEKKEACKNATTFCRKLPANENNSRVVVKRWALLPMEEADLLSKPDADFEIIEDWKPHWNQPLKIGTGDRLRIWKESNKIRLDHYNKNGNLVAHVKSLELKNSDGGKLWAIGDVYFGTSPQADGEYIVYRTSDSEDCKHSERFNNNPCRQFHFEYFKKGAPRYEYPTFCVNIEPPNDGTCDGSLENDEGDGDEGKLRKAMSP